MMNVYVLLAVFTFDTSIFGIADSDVNVISDR